MHGEHGQLLLRHATIHTTVPTAAAPRAFEGALKGYFGESPSPPGSNAQPASAAFAAAFAATFAMGQQHAHALRRQHDTMLPRPGPAEAKKEGTDTFRA